MKQLGILGAILLVFIAVSGCSTINRWNTKSKEKVITTGLFNGDTQKMAQAIKSLESGIGKMTKEDVAKAGFNFYADNVRCLKGTSAMPYVVGNVQNNIDLSTEEKIDAYAKTVSSYEACILIEQRTKSRKPRLYWSNGKEKIEGPELSYLIIFKKNILFDAKETSRMRKNETETDKSTGGNMLEGIIGTSLSAGRKYGF